MHYKNGIVCTLAIFAGLISCFMLGIAAGEKAYPQDIQTSWAKWIKQYNQTMTDPDKAIGLSYSPDQGMTPTMSHKKASWQHARVNFLLGRFYENESPENKKAVLDSLKEYTVEPSTNKTEKGTP